VHRALVEVCLADVATAKAVEEALRAEVEQPAAPRKGRVSMARRGSCVMLRVEAASLSGLRAILNSYLYLVHAAYSALEASRGASFS
jgi:tRNA threonylcarbamoyladenosine modification (KEOPS) complex  Pcc1 subunit